MSQLRYYGHACFSWENQGTVLLFDPFLKDNPFQIAQPEDMDCHYILVSHGHFDHLGDAVAIAKRTGATIISTAEIANLCARFNPIILEYSLYFKPYCSIALYFITMSRQTVGHWSAKPCCEIH